MAQPQQQTYPCDIPSISNFHPGIPAHVVNMLHLDENIANGDPIDIRNVEPAEGIVSSLASLQVHEQAVTDDVVETAKNRAAIIRSTHGQLQFDGGGNAAILALLNAMNNTLNSMNNTLDRMSNTLDHMNNTLDCMNNTLDHINGPDGWLSRSLAPGQVLHSHQKEVIGSGTALAQQINGGALPPNIDINPPANVGTAPGNLNPFAATDNEILCLYLIL
ncbi:hypothetical protein JB92DRAFT_3147430 [Gautieria morchelliformis]|nr:hypothetical protein JB92DRAFT_3147430 [Gautieria morchelliformis]